ncbi:MAG: hypothetical protein WC455_14255 [Dehalococcoidia bacterium]|jgi:hypothetical protein
MTNEIVVSDPNFLAPAASVANALAVYQAKKEFINGVLRPSVDYGTIAGSDKPALFKPGAEKMVSFFGLSPVFEDIQTAEDWTGEQHGGEPFFYYRQKCRLFKGDRLIATADGSCNSWEKKYRYRSSERVCPNCGKATIIKGRAEYGGGWVCFAKKGGCGAKFRDGDPAIEKQEIGQIKNPDVSEQVNTILKMAQKRALVAAVLIGTAISDYFTQDVEDFMHGDVINAEFRDAATAPVAAPRQPDVIIAELGYDAQAQPTNGSTRPYPPAALFAKIEDRSKVHATKVAPDRLRKAIAATLDTIFDGDKTKRYELCKWLTGKASTKDIPDAYVHALSDWLGVTDFSQPPHEHAMTEARTALAEALKAAGQQELL